MLTFLRRITAGERDQQRLALAVELRLRARARPLVQCRVQSALREASARALYRGPVHVQCRSDLVVECALTGPQQRVGASDHAGRCAALAYIEHGGTVTITKNGQPILDLDHWSRVAGPKSAQQWVEDRSVMEAARYWLAARATLPPLLAEPLGRHDDFGMENR